MTKEKQEAVPFTTWYCPRCHWYRDCPLIPEHQQRIIDHPVYGPISGYNSYLMDVTRHSCEATRAARERHGIPNVKRIIPYTRRIERRAA